MSAKRKKPVRRRPFRRLPQEAQDRILALEERCGRLERLLTGAGLTLQQRFDARCTAHDLMALERAIETHTRYVKPDERDAALTHWRSTGAWPAWLLAERGEGHLTVTQEERT